MGDLHCCDMNFLESHCQCGVTLPKVKTDTHRYIPATPECWALFNQVLARDYSDQILFDAAHRITVDAYAAQHAENHPAKSLMTHLVGLHAIFDLGLSSQAAGACLKSFVEGRSTFPELSPPQGQNRMTIEDLVAAKDCDTHISIARNWAFEVWQSWSEHHEFIAMLVGEGA